MGRDGRLRHAKVVCSRIDAATLDDRAENIEPPSAGADHAISR